MTLRGECRTGSGQRANRGGSFNNPAVNARSANRNRNAPSNANNTLGVRPAKTSAARSPRPPAPRGPRRRARDACYRS